jgi:hypothetical protein
MEKNIPDNKNGKPLEYYGKQFRSMEPEKMSARSGFPYDSEASAFRLRFLSRDVLLSYPEMELRYADGDSITAPSIRILLSRAVMEGMKKPHGGEYLAYAQVPWGEVYLRQFTGRCVTRLAFSFGNKPDAFDRACTALGGVAASGADRAYTIEFLDGLYLRLLLWEPDDEFPPSAQILFSDNFPAMYTAEDMAVVGDVLISALKENSK